ncbi:MAG: amidase [Alphaproteobacteria bacterium]|nr:amidase [Alphaproteobacteria bacterium]
MTGELNALGAAEIARRIGSKQTTAVEVMSACLARVKAREETVGAFIHLDEDKALAAAEAADKAPAGGLLHGVPFAIKDIIDTADFPTGWGSPIYHGYQPPRNASCVELLMRQGAIPVGKTVSTEFAYFQPGKTANPHNPGHTPGGSSSGSAAAVADGMVPLAFGSQTAGSMIRPAAFCGVLGYKASHGGFDLQGVMGLSASLDTLGLMAREVEDLVLARAAMCGAGPAVHPAFANSAPRIGLVRGPDWSNGSAEMRDVCERAMARLAEQGAETSEIGDLSIFSNLEKSQKVVMAFETARARIFEFEHYRGQLSHHFIALMEDGLALSRRAYEEALGVRDQAQQGLSALFQEADVLLTPSAPGEAPEGLSATGDPLYNRPWTLLQVPCVSVPFGAGPRGLPLSVQLIGQMGDDDRLLAAADWVHQCLRGE